MIPHACFQIGIVKKTLILGVCRIFRPRNNYGSEYKELVLDTLPDLTQVTSILFLISIVFRKFGYILINYVLLLTQTEIKYGLGLPVNLATLTGFLAVSTT